MRWALFVILSSCVGPPVLSAIKAGRGAYETAQTADKLSTWSDDYLRKVKKHEAQKREDERIKAILHGQPDPYPPEGCTNP